MTKCPNPHCVNGRVGAVACAVCKGEEMRETSHTLAQHSTLAAPEGPYTGPVGKHGPYGTHTNLDGSPVARFAAVERCTCSEGLGAWSHEPHCPEYVENDPDFFRDPLTGFDMGGA